MRERSHRSRLAFFAALLAAASLLGSVPAQGLSAEDPLVLLLSSYTVASEPLPAARPGSAEAATDQEGLARLESGLSLMSQGLEAFRNPRHFEELRRQTVPNMAPEIQPYFSDRGRALDAIYRTLAVIDYTWVLRGEEPEACPALSARSRLLSSPDGLFVDPRTGRFSPWLARILRRAGQNEDAAGALDEASASGTSTASYEARLARLHELRGNLQDEKLSQSDRTSLLCGRAKAYEALAAANRDRGGAVEAGREAASQAFAQEAGAAVVFVRTAGQQPRAGAGTIIETKDGPWVLTNARLVLDPEGRAEPGVEVTFRDGRRIAAKPLRWDTGLGLALLDLEGRPEAGQALKWVEPAEVETGESVYALGHPEQGGPWSLTQGLVTGQSEALMRTDAVLGRGNGGGPVLSAQGELVGIATGEAGGAVKASVAKRWVEGTWEGPAAAAAAADHGTAAILTQARMFDLDAAAEAGELPAEAPGQDLTEAGYVPTVKGHCVAYCDSAPSGGYSGDGNGGVFGLVLRGVFHGLANMRPEPKPKSAPRPARPQVVEQPKGLPSLTGLALSAQPQKAKAGDMVSLSARVRLSDPRAAKSGIRVTFSPGGLSALTDGAGQASARIALPDQSSASETAVDFRACASANSRVTGSVCGDASVVEVPKPQLTYTISADKGSVAPGGWVTFTVDVKGNLPEIQTAGLRVDFTVAPDRPLEQKVSAVTNSAGQAFLKVQVAPDRKNFDDLVRESDKHPGGTNAAAKLTLPTSKREICQVVIIGAAGTLVVTAAVAAVAASPVTLPTLAIGGVAAQRLAMSPRVGPACAQLATGAMAAAVATCGVLIAPEVMITPGQTPEGPARMIAPVPPPQIPFSGRREEVSPETDSAGDVSDRAAHAQDELAREEQSQGDEMEGQPDSSAQAPLGNGPNEEKPRNPADDKKLTPSQIRRLQDRGVDVHELKGGRGASQKDLYYDRDGNIYVKPKGGSGPGEPTGERL